VDIVKTTNTNVAVEPILKVDKLRKTFPSPEGGVSEVVRIESFILHDGEQAALAGESGSGKTTFLNLVAGLLKADSGQIILSGKNLETLNESGRDLYRAQNIGYIFQTFNLLQGYTALENVEMGMAFGQGIHRPYAESLLIRVGLGKRLHYYPRQMSVGQQQRVAVARALANHPRLVLADEPTGHLDPKMRGESLALVREICIENKAALLLVSHDEEVLSKFERVEDFGRLNRPVVLEAHQEVRK
jgi:putative ABC transport system ATP-binding protein